MSGKKDNGNSLLLFCILVFILQLILSNYVHFGPYVHICLLPLLIALMPFNWRPSSTLLVSFALGLLLDLLSDGVIGLNAGAAVCCAAPKKYLYHLTTNSDRQDRSASVSRKRIGNAKYFTFLAVCAAVFTLAYVLLDCMDLQNWGLIPVRFLASATINFILSSILSISFLRKN